MIRHLCLVLLIIWYCILLFEDHDEFLLIDVQNIPKNPTKSMRATLACLFTCVCIAHVL